MRQRVPGTLRAAAFNLIQVWRMFLCMQLKIDLGRSLAHSRPSCKDNKIRTETSNGREMRRLPFAGRDKGIFMTKQASQTIDRLVGAKY